MSFEPGSNEQLVWAPIRHHSPQCSWQLIELFKQHKPDILLVEGPSEASHLIEFLQAGGTKPPVAFYTYSVTGTSHWMPAKSHANYRCYVPFAEMSPEWNAIQLAKKYKRPVEFIDMPYANQLELDESRHLKTESEERFLYDETEYIRSDPVQELVEADNCRDFDEWWERHFESGVDYQDPQAYFNNIHQFCALVRKSQTGSQTNVTLARESYMAERIQTHLDAGKKCLVVTGGFHCIGIDYFLRHPGQKIKINSAQVETRVHLIPYSLQRLNKGSGYAAGMPDCGYYHQLWRGLNKDESKQVLTQTTHFSLIADLISNYQQHQYPVTLPDGVEAAALSLRLADLRQVLPGRLEFKDAITTAFLKQANEANFFNQILQNKLAGELTGTTSAASPIAPLVEEFRLICEQYRLPKGPAEPVEKGLAIYKNERQRSLSRIFHRLSFLQVPYAEFKAGPRFAQSEDLQRVREIWRLRWQVESEAWLAECSHLGDSLVDAALNQLLTHLNDNKILGKEKVPLLISALSMGLHQVFEPILAVVEDWLGYETEVTYLCEGLNHLVVAYNASTALSLGRVPGISNILRHCFERICVRLHWLKSTQVEDTETICLALLNIHGLVTVETVWCDQSLFYDALRRLKEESVAPQIKGACVGILYGSGRYGLRKTEQEISCAFGLAHIEPNSLGEFFWGFLMVAKGLFIKEAELAAVLTGIIGELDEEEFLNLLPALRLAFTTLSPHEKKELAISLTENEGAGWRLQQATPWSQAELEMSVTLKTDLTQLLAMWGMKL